MAEHVSVRIGDVAPPIDVVPAEKGGLFEG
jgi:hypothetical protein